MKRIVLMIIITIASNNLLATEILPIRREINLSSLFNRPQTDTTLTKIMVLNLDSFKTKSVDAFLAKLPGNYISKKVFGKGRPRYAEDLIVKYPNKVVVHIIVREFTHMNPRSNTLQWDINLFKLEKIDHIEVHAGPECLKGCPPQ